MLWDRIILAKGGSNMTHIVGYKRRLLNGRLESEKFSRLMDCCGQFQLAFNNVGRAKNPFYSSFIALPGINLLTRGSELRVVLCGTGFEQEVSHCPFCGAEISIRHTDSVDLIPKTKVVPDGYEEVPRKS